VSSWTVSILSRFEFASEEGRLLSLRSRQYAEFLAILAMSGPHGIELSRIGTDFFVEPWSDHKQALRNLCSRVKQQASGLSDLPLMVRQGDYAWLDKNHCDCDLWSFRETLERAEYSKAATELLPFVENLRVPLIGDDFISEIAGHLVSELALDLLCAAELLTAATDNARHKSIILSILNVIRPRLDSDTNTTKRLLSIYGTLRLRQELVETLADYSEYLEVGIGEEPDSQIQRFVENLLREMDTTHVDALPPPPPITQTVGNEDLLDEVIQLITDSPRVFVGGLPGVGKSHLLRAVFHHRKISQFRPLYIDLQACPRPLSADQVRERVPGLLIVDNYKASDHDQLTTVLEANPEAKLLVSGNSDQGFELESRISVPPLEVGSEAAPGDAVLLLEQMLEGLGLRKSELFTLASRTNGIPQRIHTAAKWAREFGSDLALRSLDNPEAIAKDSTAALQQMIEPLPAQSKHALRALANFGSPVSGGMLVDCLELGLLDLRRLTTLGLLEFRVGDQTFAVPASMVNDLRSLEGFEDANDSQLKFESNLVNNLARQPAQDSKIADILAVQRLVTARLSRGDSLGAFEAIRAIRSHLLIARTCVCEPSDLIPFLENLEQSAAEFIPTILSICGALFFQYRFKDVVDLMVDPKWTNAIYEAPLSVRSDWFSTLGVARARFGDCECALLDLKQSVVNARSAENYALLVKALYNLATTYAALKRFEEALAPLQEAIALSEHIPSVKARFELLHMEGLYLGDSGAELSQVLNTLHMALSYARSHSLRTEAGWVLQSIGLTFFRAKDYPSAAVALAIGTRDYLNPEMGADYRRIASFCFDIMAHCFLQMGAQALAYQAAILSLNLFQRQHENMNGLQRYGVSRIELPEGLQRASQPATSADVLLFLGQVQRYLRTDETSVRVFAQYNYDAVDA
jgi:tetratricopeptide (TPR) repeat protein